MRTEQLLREADEPVQIAPRKGVLGLPDHGPSVPGSQVPQRYLKEFAPLFAHSAKMHAVREIIEEVAPTSATVLIRGESGVGKELVARAIAYASPRPTEAFVKVNCAALPAELLES